MISDEVLHSFQGSNVIVTGGTGLIGRAVVALLRKARASIKVISLDRLSIGDDIEHVYGDLTNFDFCKKAIKDADYLFHLAGVKGSIEVAATKIASHFVPTLMLNVNVLEASRINRIRKVVYTSSIGAYSNGEVFREKMPTGDFEGPPMDFASWAKRMGELQIFAYQKQYGFENYSIVRPCNVYGPGDNFDPDNAMVIPSLMYRILHKENPLVIWGDGTAIRDFAFSRDVAEGVILALHHGTKGRYVNLGSGSAYSVRELTETLHSFLDFNYRFDSTKPSGAKRKVMDISLAKKLIGYCPSTSLLDGLKETWEWFVEHQNEHLQKVNYFKVDSSQQVETR